MTTKTEIANLALVQIAQNPVQDVDTDQSTGASTIRAVYDLCLRKLLAEVKPSFARRRVELAADATFPVGLYGYPYSYTLPPDYVCIVENTRDAQTASVWQALNTFGPIQKQWDLIGNKILSYNAGPLQVDYIASSGDPINYYPSFSVALSYSLAANTANKILQNMQLSARLEATAERYRIAAIAHAAALETPDQIINSSRWLASRPL